MNNDLFNSILSSYPERDLDAEKIQMETDLGFLLELDPRVQAILILNTTPSFNDGDPCLPYSNISTNFFSELDDIKDTIESVFESKLSDEGMEYVLKLFENTYDWSDIHNETSDFMAFKDDYKKIIELSHKICKRFDELYGTNTAFLIYKKKYATIFLTEGYYDEY